MRIFSVEAVERQRQVEGVVRAVSEEALAFMAGMLSPSGPNVDLAEKSNVQALFKKVQRLKASFTYLKFRSQMGKSNTNKSSANGVGERHPDPIAEEEADPRAAVGGSSSGAENVSRPPVVEPPQNGAPFMRRVERTVTPHDQMMRPVRGKQRYLAPSFSTLVITISLSLFFQCTIASSPGKAKY